MKTTKNQEVLQKVLMKAWEDEEFKKELVAQPQESIKKLTGEELDVPKGKKLTVIDASNNSNVFIKIPSKEAVLETELTEDQLEMIAGGVINTDDIDLNGGPISCTTGCAGDDDIPWLS